LLIDRQEAVAIERWDVLPIMHTQRLRRVANAYSRWVAVTDRGDIARAMAEDDASVAASQRANGLAVFNWPAVGITEGRDER
jgi:hypothetical protein